MASLPDVREEMAVEEACSASYQLCGVGLALPPSVSSGSYIRATDKDGTVPPQFGGGPSESICVCK